MLERLFFNWIGFDQGRTLEAALERVIGNNASSLERDVLFAQVQVTLTKLCYQRAKRLVEVKDIKSNSLLGMKELRINAVLEGQPRKIRIYFAPNPNNLLELLGAYVELKSEESSLTNRLRQNTAINEASRMLKLYLRANYDL